MWLPFFTFESWSNRSDESSIQASREDTNFRLFEFCFELINPVTLDNNIGIVYYEGLNFRRITNVYDGKDAELSFYFEGYPKIVSKLFIRIGSNHVKDCFNPVVSIISKLLSYWTFQTSASSGINRIIIRDKEHGAEWETQHISVNYYYPAIFPNKFEEDEVINSMLSLYREGKNSSSVYYRFLCFYKILESYKSSTGFFGLGRKYCSEHSLELKSRPSLKISIELLEDNKLNPDNFTYFINKKVSYFIDETVAIRNKVAHAIIDQNKSVYDFYNFDEMSSYSEICSVVNLADLLSYEILKNEFNYLDELKNLNKPTS